MCEGGGGACAVARGARGAQWVLSLSQGITSDWTDMRTTPRRERGRADKPSPICRKHICAAGEPSLFLVNKVINCVQHESHNAKNVSWSV